MKQAELIIRLLGPATVLSAVACTVIAVVLTFAFPGYLDMHAQLTLWALAIPAIAGDLVLAWMGREWLRSLDLRKEKRGIVSFVGLLVFVVLSLIVAAMRLGVSWDLAGLTTFLVSEDGWREAAVLTYALVAAAWLGLRRWVGRSRRARPSREST